jgi:Flp pilus assembly protein TadD
MDGTAPAISTRRVLVRLRRAASTACVAALAALGGCATTEEAPRLSAELFLDARFEPPPGTMETDVFALSPQMRAYLDNDLTPRLRAKGPVVGLVNALYETGQLRLTYDTDRTSTAAQTFDRRSGNCLSLVLMTAAFAKALNLSVQYQQVRVEDAWSRQGGIYFLVGHVNVTLGRRTTDMKYGRLEAVRATTIDFLPPADGSRLPADEISEDRVVAMYLNNRAGEALAAGQVNDAYWWARAAVLKDTDFPEALNTLGVIYRRHGDLAMAERAFRDVLRRHHDDTQALSNLALVLGDQGRSAEAVAVAARLRRLEPHPPYADFERGMLALQDGNYEAARDAFATEVRRDEDNHEFHFWLALSLAHLGRTEEAARELQSAIDTSTSSKAAQVYARKLEKLRSAMH